MLLVFDIGNSTIHVGLMCQRDEIQHSCSCSTPQIKQGVVEFVGVPHGAQDTPSCLSDTDKTPRQCEDVADAVRVFLSLAGIDDQSIDGAIVCSVVPELTDYVCNYIRVVFGIEPQRVDYRMNLSFEIGYAFPERLGNDLLASAQAAVCDYGAPLIIFDLGTATTCSVIDAEMNYLGGLIIPGLQISQQALIDRTSQLFAVEQTQYPPLIGNSTKEAIQSGYVNATAAMIDGLSCRIEEELSVCATIIMTGGTAEMIAPSCRRAVIYDQNLLMNGLWDMYFMNTSLQ